LDDGRYQSLVDVAFRRVVDLFDPIDSDVADCEAAGDVITITFAGKKRCVMNTQRPTRQIWLAANARAWHFSYDEKVGKWLDDKGGAHELFATLMNIAEEWGGARFPAPNDMATPGT
jgi:CyaY protein